MMVMSNNRIEELWQAMKDANCTHPPSAVRIALLSREGFIKGIRLFEQQNSSTNDTPLIVPNPSIVPNPKPTYPTNILKGEK